ncbi:GbsR/MarR family transcriptional regulator [Pontibacter sp. 13R65]|uniref:GbsR/MarR family transcriptional regulator n=1 Tax=Pontibacter sp. 13R65 TaxID=3127458 RepID=UPI00301C779F
MTLNQQQALQIERIGIFFDKDHFPPLAGRIMALLLIAEPPYCSFEQIIENLQAGKSSVSASLNMLLREGLIDFRTFPGNKKRYFYINARTWLEMLRKRVEQLGPFRSILQEVAQSRSAKHPEFNHMLQEMNQFYGEIEEALTHVMKSWSERINHVSQQPEAD